MGIQKLMSLMVLGLGLASMSWAAMDGYQKQCRFARYPKLCVETLNGSGSGKSHSDIISLLVKKTISETKLHISELLELSSQFQVQEGQQHARPVTDYCGELMHMTHRRLDQSLKALQHSPTKNKHNIQTWLSAAITFQQACKDMADNNNNNAFSTFPISHISNKTTYLSQSISNPLSLVNRINSGKVSDRRIAKEQAFPEWVSAGDRKLLEGDFIEADAIVAKDGSGDYETVREAIVAASGGRFVIYVKAGVYKEKIRCNKDGITLIGAGKYSTTIVGDDSVAGGTSMPSTATFTITGDNFIARDIRFENNAGVQGEQALALYIASDHSVLYRCSLVGYQDTLYAVAMRQFYRECDIYGTIDFIFGNAAAVFQNSNIILRRPRDYGVIMANGRSDPGQSTGFSVQNCHITVSGESSTGKHSFTAYLGRPWKQYSRAVYMETVMADVIAPRGWVEWPGEGSKTLSKLYFGEYSNIGPGAIISKRVNWPGFHVLERDEAVKFTVANLISGTSWLPSTGVDFTSGLQ